MDEIDKALNESRGKEVPTAYEYIDSQQTIESCDIAFRCRVKSKDPLFTTDIVIKSLVDFLTEYSDLKCQHLEKQIEKDYNFALETISGLTKQSSERLNRIQELQEAADKLAEALQHSYATEQEWAIKRQEALANYNKLKGK